MFPFALAGLFLFQMSVDISVLKILFLGMKSAGATFMD